MTLHLKGCFTVFFLFIFSAVIAQEKFTLSGTIADGSTKETLIGASVYIKELETAVSTNASGFYSISLPAGTYTLQVSYVSFGTVEQTIVLTKNTRKNFNLANSSAELQEVVISQNTKKANIKSPEMSVNKLTAQDIKKMPVVMGEVDVIRSLMTLPGVTNGGEGASGFNVRGGAADQNLILLDDATLFNSSHLFGFFSVFNSDAIKDLNLYKGGIPARFGGRASSVLDINQREGNTEDYHAQGGIGLISSRLVAEGPINKGKGSFLIGGRTSYAHLFLKLADNENTAYFYDVNMRLKYDLNAKNKIYLSGYLGRDVIKINDNFSNVYGNTVLNFGWNHKFSDDVSSNMAAIYSDYLYGMELDFIGFNWDSGIESFTFKYDFKHKLNEKFKLTYGASGIYYNFNPGTITPSRADSGINARQLDRKYAFESALYLDATNELTNKLSVTYGLRYSMFSRLGSQTVNVYENNQAVVYNDALQIYEKAVPIGTQFYGRNKSIANFGNLEPRAAVSYQLNEDASVKVSYNRMAQYLHLISNTASATPLDVWAPSDNFMKPQLLDQIAAGYFRNFKNDTYSLETEVFYKTLKNRVDYIDGADLIANDAIEQVVLPGKARAYGLEVLFRKNTGKLTGWVAYTLSRAEQQTPGRTPNESGINGGKWYHTGYDKLHNISVTGSYAYTDKWSFSAIFALQSGQPVTFPNGQYTYGDINIPSYGLRNEDRLPMYHHLDVSATYSPKPEKKKGWQGEWVFSIYNLYNRQNAASISFRQNEDTGSNEAVRLSIFGIIPSVTYNFKF
jgi:hypothetical protein